MLDALRFVLDALRARETWVGRPGARERWLTAGVVVGLVVAVFHAPPTAYPLAALGFPTGWGVAGFALLFGLALAIGAGVDRAGVLVGVAVAGLSVFGWIAPGLLWPSPMDAFDPLGVAGRWTRDVTVLGVAGYLVGASARRAVAFARGRRGQAASTSNS